ncbi:MAG TPA: SDR family NAD(P)-dependent oxidoreductase [Candidatus Limnocylindrales bacterium]|nr:SDR family NAD(P)-dependent oxidoreductase [Candidatus Limnocylindrales bacterium]
MENRVAVVTGASRGVGKGVALELGHAGFTVYITGRSAADMGYIQGRGTAIVCDHCDDQQVERAFAQIGHEQNRIDVLVNNAWGGYENMIENGEFTWSRPFWQQPVWRWDAMFHAGVRAAYVASRLAAPFMILKRSGLIVNISFWSAQKHIGNVAYGVAKAATDKLTSDTALELKEHNVAAVSLYPGLVRTEKVMAAAEWLNLSNSESPEFTGRAVVALANDNGALCKSGKILTVAALAHEYAFTDIDGKLPRPLTLADV